MRIFDPVGSNPVSTVQKTSETCTAPYQAEFSYTFLPPATTVDFFSVDIYSGHNPALSDVPVKTLTLPGNVHHFTAQVNLGTTVDYTLRIATHITGTSSSYVIIEDVIKLS